MDEFSSQSRDDNDLFSDDFEPAPESSTSFNGAAPDFRPATILSNPLVNQSSSRGQVNNNQRGGKGGRGGLDRRHGGRGGLTQGGGLATSRYADSPPATQATATLKEASTSTAKGRTETTKKSPPPEPEALNPVTTMQDTQLASQPASKPTENATSRPHAVRGDRSATGGPAHKKLTEEEMTEKLERMKIMDAVRAERFRKSEADQAAFQQKEVELIKRREDEVKNRRAMDMERAKNRERKLRSQGGREWDESKTEADIVDRSKGRSSEYVEGGHGGVINGRGDGLARSSHTLGGLMEGQGTNDGPRQKGGDGRGHSGRGGRGKGEGRGGVDVRNGQKLDSSTKTDFPPLPMAPKAATESTKAAPTVAALPAFSTLQTESKPVEWAEEMATPVVKAAEV